ncbi:hypothetical protein IJS98_04860 [bacterium]|nr:hypothetical protein [bacterium]
MSTKFSDRLTLLRPLAAGAALFSLILIQFVCRLQYGPGGALASADSAKFVRVALEGGTVHTPLFPLYTLLLRVFSHLKFIYEPGANLALLSALLVALGLVFLWDALSRRYKDRFFTFFAVLAVSFLPYVVTAATEVTPIALSLCLFFFAYAVIANESVPIPLKFVPCGLLAFHDPLALWFFAIILPFAAILLFKAGKGKLFFTGLALALAAGLIPYLYAVFAFKRGESCEYLRQEDLWKSLFCAVLNGQFWNNYFVLPFSDYADSFLNCCRNFYIFSALSLFVIPILLLGVFFRKETKFATIENTTVFAALLATLLFLVPTYHFYPAQWFWLLNAYIALFLACAFVYISKAKEMRLVLCPLLFIGILVMAVHSFDRVPARRSAFEAAKLAQAFGALPYGSVLLTEDVYSDGEVYRYHLATLPKLVAKNVDVKDEIVPGKRNFFISPTVKGYLEEQNVPFHLVSGFDGLAVYELGEKRDSEE